MEPIKKNGLDREVKRHEMNVEKIQTIVNDMIETGFAFGNGELRDLGSSCVILHDRAIEMAQKDSSRIRISFKRDADYKETLDRLNETIENKARELKKALLYHTSTPLEMAKRVTARTAAFMPGASPPEVSTPMRLNVFID